MIYFYEDVQSCLQLSLKSTQTESVPDLFILNLDKVNEELSAVSNILNFSLPRFQFVTRHSGRNWRNAESVKCSLQREVHVIPQNSVKEYWSYILLCKLTAMTRVCRPAISLAFACCCACTTDEPKSGWEHDGQVMKPRAFSCETPSGKCDPHFQKVLRFFQKVPR